MFKKRYYILMEADKKVCLFETQNVIIKQKIIDRKRMPKKDLNIWVEERIIPKKHSCLWVLHSSIAPRFYPRKIFFNSYGLSLTDCYWICEISRKEYLKGRFAKVNVKWDNINFFKNDFEHGYAYALYNIYDYIHNKIDKISDNSPGICLNGYAAKYWTIENEKRICYKKFLREDNLIKKELEYIEKLKPLFSDIEFINYEETDVGYKTECFIKDKERLISMSSLNYYTFEQIEKYLKKIDIKNYKRYMELLHYIKEELNLPINYSNIEVIENIETHEYRLAPFHLSVK